MYSKDDVELAMDGYKCYLSPVVDCYDGMPVSWSLSLHPDSALCDSSLRSCLDSLPPGSAPTVHTDGGGPYRSASWKALCSERGVTRSMSRPGRSGDNAPAEGLFGTFRTEFLEPLDRAGVGLEELRRSTATWSGTGTGGSSASRSPAEGAATRQSRGGAGGWGSRCRMCTRKCPHPQVTFSRLKA